MVYVESITAKNETRTIRDLNGQQMLATIEASTTASKAYAVGDYLIANDKIYKVTAAIASGGTITVGTNVAEAKVGTELTELNRQINYLGNWAYLTKGAGENAVAFSVKQGHTYTVVNTSASGGLTFILRETPTGENLQTVYNLNAGTTHDFTANQDANYIGGWQASEQTFFIIDKSSKVLDWDGYQDQINNLINLKVPYVLTDGGFDAVDGTISPNQYYSYTDFIDCSPFGKIRIVSPNGALNYCSWYKEDKTTGVRFTVAQGDVSLTAPEGYKYARLSAPTNSINGISIYTALWFNGAISRDFLNEIKGLLPNRFEAKRDTAGTTDYTGYTVTKGHSYLLINNNNFSCSFTPKNQDYTSATTTISAKSVNMCVSEVDGYCNCYFAGDNGALYIYDMDGESIRKTISDLNIDACDAIVSAKYKTSATPHLLSLIHFSDIHADATALRRLINFDSDMSKYVDDAICTGDIVSSKFGDSFDFWTTSEDADKILTCVGNHDSYYTNSMDSAQMVPMSDVAEKFIVPFESEWGSIVRPSGCTYYYKDYPSGYRLIVLDAIRINLDAENEATWLTNALADARANDLAVIIAMHYMPTGAMHIYDCAFSKYSEFGDSGNICNAPQFAVQDIIQDFIDEGGTFMCYLIGHLHRDIFGYASGKPDQPCIMVTTASASRAESEVNADLGRAIGTKMQDAFNVVTFDKDNGVIKVVRVGADVDNLMRPRKAISYNIDSKTFPHS